MAAAANSSAAADGADMKRSESQNAFPKNKIKVLLLENVHADAVAELRDEMFDVTTVKSSMSEDELCKAIEGVHAIGLRSKTKITARVLEHANRLLCIGCFCIGTDQVDLEAAEKKGIPVFNSPFSNSRSVAELVIGEIISLARKLGDNVQAMHRGEWNKSSTGCVEVRGKTLGIVGYGHIGSQLSVLAEAMGMRVCFYDTVHLMPLGNAVSCDSLAELLGKSDFVSLHVPRTDETKDMMNAETIKLMKDGAFLINNSRGTVVDLAALADALKSGKLGGAAVDVFPVEPAANGPGWESPLQGLPNVILTPHIGGSTAEAQAAIGVEVAQKLIALINLGSTATAVNFPQCDLSFMGPHSHRIIHTHQNKPGILSSINSALADVNVRAQVLRTSRHTGYVIVDVEKKKGPELKRELNAIAGSLRTRLLY